MAAVGYTLGDARGRPDSRRAASRRARTQTAGGSFTGKGVLGTARLVVDERRGVIVGATFTGAEVAEMLHAATIAVVGRSHGPAVARRARLPHAQRAVAAAAGGLRVPSARRQRDHDDEGDHERRQGDEPDAPSAHLPRSEAASASSSSGARHPVAAGDALAGVRVEADHEAQTEDHAAQVERGTERAHHMQRRGDEQPSDRRR